RVRQRLNEILARHTGQPLAKIEKDTDRNFYMNAEEAKKYGIIDEIIRGKASRANGLRDTPKSPKTPILAA
ncbi:MAG: ATP-dependent Clp protease proteolytic subunit, partial [Patescibacteria group bacterium]